MRWRWLAALPVGLLGCSLLAPSDADLGGGLGQGASTTGPGGQGGSAGNGGEGGGGGGSSSVAAPDWTAYFTAVFRFDDTLLPGRNSAPSSIHASVVAGSLPPEVVPNDPVGTPQGSHHLELVANVQPETASSLRSGHEVFQAGTSDLTYGCWMRPDLSAEPDLLRNVIRRSTDATLGYKLMWDNRPANPRSYDCHVYGNAGSLEANQPIDPNATEDTWNHVACRFTPNATAGTTIEVITDLADPIADIDGSFVYEESANPFYLSGDGYLGDLDECFVAHFAITNDDLKRIRACGIDGARCRCVEGDETQYAVCGGPPDTCAEIEGTCSKEKPDGAS